jgi:hypothetical protein
MNYLLTRHHTHAAAAINACLINKTGHQNLVGI